MISVLESLWGLQGSRFCWAPVLGFKVSRFLVHSCVTRLCRVSALTLEVLRFSGFIVSIIVGFSVQCVGFSDMNSGAGVCVPYTGGVCNFVEGDDDSLSRA